MPATPVHQAAIPRTSGFSAADEQYPALARAMAERGLSAGQIYDLVVADILDAIDAAVEPQRARWTPRARKAPHPSPAGLVPMPRQWPGPHKDTPITLAATRPRPAGVCRLQPAGAA